MDRARTPLLLAAALIASTAACRAGRATSAGETTITSGSLPAAFGTYAPAGQRIALRLDKQLDTARSSAGEPFTATLERPILASNGTAIAQEGAKISGFVEAIDLGGAQPRIQLRFEQLESVSGPLPIATRLVSAEHRIDPSRLELRGPGVVNRVPERLVIPAGGRIDLELVRPIVLAGTATP